MIFTFWTGTNQMSENRIKSLDTIAAFSGVPVALITRKNLYDFAIYPIHKAYEYLSDVHKSDYLRCYFMHYFGGGYCDIKHIERPWKPAFERLEKSGAYALGYKEVSPNHVAECNTPEQKKELQLNYRKLIGCGAFIFMSYTPMTQDWFNAVESVMTAKYELLKANPGNVRGDNPGYPLRWTELLGDILHPLCLKYQGKILQDDSIKPNFNKNYL